MTSCEKNIQNFLVQAIIDFPTSLKFLFGCNTKKIILIRYTRFTRDSGTRDASVLRLKLPQKWQTIQKNN